METAATQTIKSYRVDQIFDLAVKEGNFVNHYNILADDLQDAIKKSKTYCESTGTKRRFIHVRSFITDLEKKHLDSTKE